MKAIPSTLLCLAILIVVACGSSRDMRTVKPLDNPEERKSGVIAEPSGNADELSVMIACSIEGKSAAGIHIERVRMHLSAVALRAVKRIQCPEGWTVNTGNDVIEGIAAPPYVGTVRSPGIIWTCQGKAPHAIAWVAVVFDKRYLLNILRVQHEQDSAGAAPGTSPPFRPTLVYDYGAIDWQTLADLPLEE